MMIKKITVLGGMPNCIAKGYFYLTWGFYPPFSAIIIDPGGLTAYVVPRAGYQF